MKNEPYNCNQCGHIGYEVGEFDECSDCGHQYRPIEAGPDDSCPECGSNCYELSCPKCGSATDYMPINTMIGYVNKKAYRAEQALKKLPAAPHPTTGKEDTATA